MKNILENAFETARKNSEEVEVKIVVELESFEDEDTGKENFDLLINVWRDGEYKDFFVKTYKTEKSARKALDKAHTFFKEICDHNYPEIELQTRES